MKKTTILGLVLSLLFLSACSHTSDMVSDTPMPTEPDGGIGDTKEPGPLELQLEAEKAEMEAKVQSMFSENANYELVQTESELAWRGEKITGAHEGLMLIESGNISVQGEKISGNFVVDMESIVVTDVENDGSQSLVDHLKSEDFFNTAEFPMSEFIITESEKTADTKYILTGNLMIKGISNKISFPVEFAELDDKVIALADFAIDRTKWDIKYGSGAFFDDLGDKAIEDQIQFRATLSFAAAE